MHLLHVAIKVKVAQIERWIFGLSHFLIIEDHPLALLEHMANLGLVENRILEFSKLCSG